MNISVIFGSRSVEHDVSITSAYGIMKWLRKTWKYNIFPIYITQKWKWIYNPEFEDINNFKNLENLEETDFLIDFSKSWKLCATQRWKWLFKKSANIEIDVVIPVLHWFFGEDWTVQWVLDLLQVPYASPSVVWSAVWMNKTIMKNVFSFNWLPITRYKSFTNKELDLEKIERDLRYPLFVKPANLWSSIWVSKVNNKAELENWAELAYHFDNEIIVEEWVENLIELNCCVLEKDWELISSLVERPVSSREFLDFEEKYTSIEWWTMQWVKNKVKIPADISDELTSDVKEMAIKAYKVLKCNWWAPRFDFLYNSKNWELYLNEINCIPWALQVYLWEKSWLLVPDFLETIINTAIRKNNEKKLNIDFKSNIIDYTIWFQK